MTGSSALVAAERTATKLEITITTTTADFAHRTESHQHFFTPDVDRFLHQVNRGENNEHWLADAIRRNDQNALNAVFARATAAVREHRPEIEAHFREGHYDASQLNAHAHDTVAIPAFRRQERINRLEEAPTFLLTYETKYGFARNESQGVYLTLCGLNAPTNAARFELFQDALTAGFSAATVLSTARYLDQVYGTSYANQFAQQEETAAPSRDSALIAARQTVQQQVLSVRNYLRTEEDRIRDEIEEAEEKRRRRNPETPEQAAFKLEQEAEKRGLRLETVVADSAFQTAYTGYRAEELSELTGNDQLAREAAQARRGRAVNFTSYDPAVQSGLLNAYAHALYDYLNPTSRRARA